MKKQRQIHWAIYGIFLVTALGACAESVSNKPEAGAVDRGVADAQRADAPGGADAFAGADAGAQKAQDATTQREAAVVADASSSETAAAYAKELVSIAEGEVLIAKGELQLIDVREPSELAASGCIGGALNLPWTSGVFTAKLNTLPKDRGLLIYCRSGSRSSAASRAAAAAGHRPVYDLQGGITAWMAAQKPVQTTGCGLP